MDVSFLASAINKSRIVFINDEAFGLTQIVQRQAFHLDSQLFGNHASASQNSNVFQHGFASITKSRRLDGNALQGAADFIHDQCRQGFPFDIFSDQEQRFAALRHLLQDRQQVFHG